VPDPYAVRPNAVVIGRLVLDIPGIDVERARAIAESLALQLGTAGISGTYDRVTVELDSDEDLPARIAAALKERLL
jgi:hypothetical protein